jgi:hypothetical protein
MGQHGLSLLVEISDNYVISVNAGMRRLPDVEKRRHWMTRHSSVEKRLQLSLE